MRRIFSEETLAAIACLAGLVFIALAIIMQDERFWREVLLR